MTNETLKQVLPLMFACVVCAFLAIGSLVHSGRDLSQYAIEIGKEPTLEAIQKVQVYTVQSFDVLKPLNNFDKYVIFVTNKFPHALERISVSDLEYIYSTIVPILHYNVNKIRRQYGLKELPKSYYATFILSWIDKESSFKPKAKSKSGAYGLLQVKYSVWKKRFGISKRSDLYNIQTNLYAGVQIFLTYLKQSKGRIQVALQKYNAGPRKKHLGKKYAWKIMSKTRKVYRDLHI